MPPFLYASSVYQSFVEYPHLYESVFAKMWSMKLVIVWLMCFGVMGDEIIKTTDKDNTDKSGTDFESDDDFNVDVRSSVSDDAPNRICKCRCGERNEASRIVGGVESAVNEFPWVARLTYFKKFYCGGMIINDRYVMSAAHCVKGLMWFMIKVTLGEHNRCNETYRPITRYVVNIVSHNFTYVDFKNDLALLKLNEPVEITDTVKPVCLPHNDDNEYIGIKAIAAGWGSIGEQKNHSCNLLEVELPVISNQDCKNTKYDSAMIAESMLCAGYPSEGNRDTCQGDSGGPLSAERKDKRYELLGCGIPYSQKNTHSRTVGGEPIHRDEMPWLAYVHTNESSVSGTLISDKHVITAASSVYELLPSRVSVTLGTNDICEKVTSAFNASVEAILIHPKYSPTRKNNDLALLKLRNHVSFSEHITPICMPLYDIGHDKRLVEIASIASDNMTSSMNCVTHSTPLSILSERTCLTYANSSLITSDKGCLGPVGAPGTLCESDIGSPVMTRFSSISPYRLLGVLSTASCYDAEPPLYTKIVDHLPWIHENIRRDCQCF
ncbi:unnamed protein product [Leptosia nina]|uniref:Peptidase S1 domain-containing protein n=1 Tax=Leptosia nina TaxID=320188 RepID=A0AAV1J5Z9_9NEOP